MDITSANSRTGLEHREKGGCRCPRAAEPQHGELDAKGEGHTLIHTLKMHRGLQYKAHNYRKFREKKIEPLGIYKRRNR